MQIVTKPHLSLAEFDADDTAKVVVCCPLCHTESEMVLSLDALHRWVIGGELVQNAFPDLSVSEREALISGICDPCWPEEED